MIYAWIYAIVGLVWFLLLLFLDDVSNEVGFIRYITLSFLFACIWPVMLVSFLRGLDKRPGP